MADQAQAPTRGATLKPAELAWLLQRHRIEPAGDGSPLAESASAKAAADAAAFERDGLLGAEWKRALSVLSAPDRQIRVLVPGVDASLLLFFYGRAGGELVGYWHDGEGARVSFPWEPASIASMGSLTLLATPPPSPQPFTTYLSPPGLALLAAAIDVLREGLFRSILARESEVARTFDGEALLRQLQLGLSHHDTRWFVTLLNMLRPQGVPMGVSALGEGVEELAAAGLVRIDGATVTASPSLIGLAMQLRSTLPAAAFEDAGVVGGSVTEYAYRIVVRGDGPLWVMDYGSVMEGRPMIQVRSVGPGEYFDGLTDILSKRD